MSVPKEVDRPHQVSSARFVSGYSARYGSLLAVHRSHVFAESSSGELGVALRAGLLAALKPGKAGLPPCGLPSLTQRPKFPNEDTCSSDRKQLHTYSDGDFIHACARCRRP
jgi:hypothetical protein